MKKIVTHSGGFHADDVFAVATFQLLLGKENIEVIRTRDDDVIARGDYVVDVGGVYDHESKRYDHHQNSAPVRENGIPYAGFGLVWKHYGAEVCGSDEVAAAHEEKLVMPIDAGDNGVSLYELNDIGVAPYELFQVVSSFAPAWSSGESKDDAFNNAVDWARTLLRRLIKREFAHQAMLTFIAETYEATEDKRILFFDVPVSAQALIQYPEVDIIVAPDDPQSNDNWAVTTVREQFDSFEPRVRFPEECAGLRGEQLQTTSGISDAVFCHKARFVFIAGSKEGALAAAKLVS